MQLGLNFWCKLGTSKRFKRKGGPAQAQRTVGIWHWDCSEGITELLLLLHRSLRMLARIMCVADTAAACSMLKRACHSLSGWPGSLLNLGLLIQEPLARLLDRSLRSAIALQPVGQTFCYALQYRWNTYKSLRDRIDKDEGGLEKFTQGEEQHGCHLRHVHVSQVRVT